MIQITLNANGTRRTYRSTGVRMRACLEAYRLAEEYEKCSGEYPEELIERCIEFVLEVFGRAFTQDDLLDGYEGSPFALFPQLIREVIAYANDRIVDFPIPAAKAMTTKEA